SGGTIKAFQIEKRPFKLLSWTDTEIHFLAPKNVVDGAVNIVIERKPIGSTEAPNAFLIAGSPKVIGKQRIQYRALQGKEYVSKIITNAGLAPEQLISGVTLHGNPNVSLQMNFTMPDENPHVLDGSEAPEPAILTYTETGSSGVSVSWSAAGGGNFLISLQVVTPDKIGGRFSGLLKSPGKKDRTIENGRFIVFRSN
ncbi:MAG TPA: hypothetical protein VKE69_14190, partial [Planctomycetota bacterium]|nr:hypothetical protein [Planctomycetota bacterium]